MMKSSLDSEYLTLDSLKEKGVTPRHVKLAARLLERDYPGCIKMEDGSEFYHPCIVGFAAPVSTLLLSRRGFKIKGRADIFTDCVDSRLRSRGFASAFAGYVVVKHPCFLAAELLVYLQDCLAEVTAVLSRNYFIRLL